MGPCLHLRFSQKLGFCPNLPDPQNVQSKKTNITFAFYAIHHFYVNVQNFWGGGRIVGPQPLLDTRYYHHHPSPLPPHPPTPWLGQYPNFSPKYQEEGSPEGRVQKICSVSVYFFCKSANLKCSYFAPCPFMMKVFLLVARWNWAFLFSLCCPSCLSFEQKRNISVVQRKAHKKRKKLLGSNLSFDCSFHQAWKFRTL